MRTLFVDIETSPNIADVWGLWNQTVSINQLRESTRMIAFGAKWEGKKTQFFSEYKSGSEEMVNAAHFLLDQADVVVHFNGKSFDVKHLNREFLLRGLNPPAPYQQVDLLQEVKRNFRFPSNKLAYLSKTLEIGGKVQHEGHTLWVKCMAGDPKAWKDMERYCIQDVDLLPKLYARLEPWLRLPNRRLYGDPEGCPGCGAPGLVRQGYAYTSLGKYQRYLCPICGKWSQGSRRVDGTDIR